MNNDCILLVFTEFCQILKSKNNIYKYFQLKSAFITEGILQEKKKLK